jgi:hypothetical protein
MTSHLLQYFWANSEARPNYSNRQWEDVLGQARQARLLGRLAAHYRDKGWLSGLENGPRLQLQSALRLTDRQSHEVRWEIDRIAHALQGLNVPVVLLKGAGYLMGGFAAANGRLFADVDLMVPKECVEKVESALFAAGWLSDERDAYNQRYYRQWMHEIPPLRHIQRNTYIDLHHTITPPTSRFNVDGAKLLAQMQPLAGFPRFFVLAPVDMVLHSAVHLFSEGEFGSGLRDMLDLNDLIGQFQQTQGFWPGLVERADELGLQVPLFYALFHLKRLFGKAIPSEVQTHLSHTRPNRMSLLLMSWALDLALRPDHPSSNTAWTGLARWVLYVRSHFIRMPMRLVVPHLIRKAWMARFPGEKA